MQNSHSLKRKRRVEIRRFKRQFGHSWSKAFLRGIRAVFSARMKFPVLYCNPYKHGTAKHEAFQLGCEKGNRFPFFQSRESLQTRNFE